MSFANIYYMANQQLSLSDLRPINEALYDALQKEHWETGLDMDFSEWKERVSEIGYDVGKISINSNPSSMRRFFYVEEYCASEIHDLEPEFLGSPFSLPVLEMNQAFEEKFRQGEFTLLFFPEWNAFAIDYFIRLFERIPKERLWEVFLLIYTYANYGFSLFPKEVLYEVFQHADKEESIERLTSNGYVDGEGFVTVYRGEGLRSTAVEASHSWTVSRDVAFKFANHFGRGRVYKAIVAVKSVISYQVERGEGEVIVRHKDLECISIEQDYREGGDE